MFRITPWLPASGGGGSEGFAPAAGPLLGGGCMGGCWGSEGGRLGPCLFGFMGLLPILCFSGSGWRGGFVFYRFFFTWKGSYVGGVFSFCFFLFHGCWELGGHFFGDFGVLGSSLDAFGAPGGSREPTLSK